MYKNILELKAAMWENESIDSEVKKGWNCVYDALKNHLENEELNFWCGVILKDLGYEIDEK